MKTRKKPERTCIVCRDKHDKRDLIRIVRDKEGHISLDSTGKKNGRGAYICTKEDCINNFFKKGALQRAFKMKISPQEIEQVKEDVIAHVNKQADSEAK